MNTILLVSAVAIIALSVLWNVIFKKNALIRFVCVVARAVLAFVGTLILKSQVVSRSTDILIGVANFLSLDPAILDAVLESGELTHIAAALVVALVSVIIFLILYFALALVMYVVRIILMAIIRPKGSHIAVRAVLGAVQGFILVTCLLIPVSTYAGIIDTAIPAFKEMAPDSDISALEEPVNAINDSLVVDVHRALGGNLISDTMTSMSLKLGDETVTTTLKSEISSLLKLMFDVTALTEKEMASYTEKETDILENLGSYVTDSKLVGAILTNVIGDAAAAWDNGQTYMGIEKPALDPTFDPLIDKTISILGADSHNAAYLSEDINTVAKMAAKLIPAMAQSTPPAEGGGEGEPASPNIAEALMTNGMIKDVLTVINENPRMRPLITTITNIGLTITAQRLGIEATSQEAYNSFTESIANELKNSASAQSVDQRQENLEKSIAKFLDDFGITNIDKTEISIISLSLIAYFESDIQASPETVTADNVAVFLHDMTNAASTQNHSQLPVIADENYGFSYLNGSNEKITGATAGRLIADICAIQCDASDDKETRIAALISESDIFNNAYGLTPEKLSEIKLNVIAGSKRSAESSAKALSTVCGLSPSDNTVFIHTLEYILVSENALNGEISKEEMENVIDSISKVFANLNDMLSSFDGADKITSMSILCTTMGEILDALHHSETFYGEEKTLLLLETIFNAGPIKSITSMSALDTQSILDAKSNSEVSYSALMNTVSSTINTFTVIQSGGNVVTEMVEELIDSLATENSGEVISIIITPDKLDSFGLANTTPEKLESASELLKEVFSNIAIETDEQRQAEVVAFEHLITLASSDSSEANEMIGEDGALGSNAGDIVDTILGSTAISSALANVDLVENPFDVPMTESDSEKMAAAINERLVGADEETTAVLHSLANLFGVTL